VIVKKVFGDKKRRNRRRKWKLRHLNDQLHNLESDSAMKYVQCTYDKDHLVIKTILLNQTIL